jgi:hypothetical protein
MPAWGTQDGAVPQVPHLEGGGRCRGLTRRLRVSHEGVHVPEPDS